MHQRDHKQDFRLRLIQYRERKTPEEPSSNCTCKNVTDLRIGDNLREHMLQLAYEIVAKSGSVGFVKIGCLKQFLLGQGVKDNVGHRSVARAFASASSAGIPSTAP